MEKGDWSTTTLQMRLKGYCRLKEAFACSAEMSGSGHKMYVHSYLPMIVSFRALSITRSPYKLFATAMLLQLMVEVVLELS